MLHCKPPGLQSIYRFDFRHVSKEQGYTRIRSRLRSLVYPWKRANYKSTRLLFSDNTILHSHRERVTCKSIDLHWRCLTLLVLFHQVLHGELFCDAMDRGMNYYSRKSIRKTWEEYSSEVLLRNEVTDDASSQTKMDSFRPLLMLRVQTRLIVIGYF